MKPNKDLNVLKQSIDKLVQDMINFLDAEKLERGQIFYNHNQIFNFSELLKKKIALFNAVVKEKEITLLSKIEENIYIKADPAAIDRILNNLLDNAIKYTEKGFINTELTAKDDKINLKVNDTGIGISDEEQKNIFSSYYQVSHDKRNIQGIGMGLYIIRQIVDELKAEIVLESKIGEGSLFTINFLLHHLTEEERNSVVNYNEKVREFIDISKTVILQEPEYDKNKSTVLVVEDNLEMLSYIQKSLKIKYNVFYAQNGKAALQKLNVIPKLHIILCDIMMDEMDGYEFYDELKTKDI
jgi:anti-sigma regulatory factor (Ser/Thr protein kinase)